MKNNNLLRKIGYLIILFLSIADLHAQRTMEILNKGLIATKTSKGIYINWRISSEDWYNTSYNLYRDNVLIYSCGEEDPSNYLDPTGNENSKYSITAIKNGIESEAEFQIIPTMTNNYHEIKLRTITDDQGNDISGQYDYIPNDATIADLDGDGEYEIILKRVLYSWAVDDKYYSYFEAYKLDGTLMWAINVGPNITDDVEMNIAAFDFDGDGKAEVFMRTSEGTIFGDGTEIGDTNNDNKTNYRLGWQYMTQGPEFLSLIDGVTGAELDRVDFIPRGNTTDWGDGTGHRCSKYFFGAPYLDGEKPSLFIGRGIYTRTIMRTYDIVDKKLVFKWEFNSDKYPSEYYGQGFHNYTIADADGDGCDEIIWGSMTINNDGKGLYSTGLGHGDAMHVGDFDPYRKGIEVWTCHENLTGVTLRDAGTGQILIRRYSGRDTGRCMAANVSDDIKGAALGGGPELYSASTRETVQSLSGLTNNFRIYWDGDILEESFDHVSFEGAVWKWGNSNPVFKATGTQTNNGTKATACVQADIFGDWREEFILRSSDNKSLRIYSTPDFTQHRVYTLMHDPQYRQAICWQMCGYNQPPHLGYYLGNDFPNPLPSKSTSGKLVWLGNDSQWNNAVGNFAEGNDTKSLISEDIKPINFIDGKSVLFDTRGKNKNITLSGTLKPELMMVSGSDDYHIAGEGSLSGNMIFDKLGEGTLFLSGVHDYSGKSTIWQGCVDADGIFDKSHFIVRRHAKLGIKGSFGKGIMTEYNSSVHIGGKDKIGKTTINDSLYIADGARLVFDIENSPETENDLLIVTGKLILCPEAVISINKSQALSPGTYILAHADDISYNINKLKLEGISDQPSVINYDQENKQLQLIIKDTRAATTIYWTGSESSRWDNANTLNWITEGKEDYFIPGDKVYFDENSISKSILISSDIMPGNVEFDSPLNYVISASGAALSGDMNLVKKNTGTLTINNINSYTGKTIIEGGTLAVRKIGNQSGNGGLGSYTTDPSKLELRNGGILNVTTENELTDIGMTLSGEEGGVINVTKDIYWNGIIKGTKLTKTGSASLMIGSNNPDLQEMVLNEGRIYIYTDASTANGVGKKITLTGGTLETLNAGNTYLGSNLNFHVPEGKTGKVIAGSRFDYTGSLTGGGTLEWVCDFYRAYLRGNWSDFTGTIKVTSNGNNGDFFFINNSYGFPNSTINLGENINMCHSASGSIKIGLLTGDSNSQFYSTDLEIGGNNKNGTYSGAINGDMKINKIGTGTWTYKGTATYTGETTVEEGALIMAGKLGN